jgi:hypothetical protein
VLQRKLCGRACKFFKSPDPSSDALIFADSGPIAFPSKRRARHVYLLEAAPAHQASGPSRRDRADSDKRDRRSGGWNDEDCDNDHKYDDHNEDRNADRSSSRRCLTRTSHPGDHDCIIDVSYCDMFLASCSSCCSGEQGYKSGFIFVTIIILTKSRTLALAFGQDESYLVLLHGPLLRSWTRILTRTISGCTTTDKGQ